MSASPWKSKGWADKGVGRSKLPKSAVCLKSFFDIFVMLSLLSFLLYILLLVIELVIELQLLGICSDSDGSKIETFFDELFVLFLIPKLIEWSWPKSVVSNILVSSNISVKRLFWVLCWMLEMSFSGILWFELKLLSLCDGGTTWQLDYYEEFIFEFSNRYESIKPLFYSF